MGFLHRSEVSSTCTNTGGQSNLMIRDGMAVSASRVPIHTHVVFDLFGLSLGSGVPLVGCNQGNGHEDYH
jgi:hypothetical protein